MQPEDKLNTALAPLVMTWGGLVLLSLLSVGLGEWVGNAPWLPAMVGAIIWLKGWLVARHFLEARLCRTLIRRMIWTFVAFAPIALVITDIFGARLARVLQV